MKLTDLLGSFRSDKTGKSHLKNLIEMATADGEFLQSEKELLKTIAKRNGFSEAQLADIEKNSASVEFEPPKDEKQKFIQLYELVQMMNVDNQIHAKEQELARRFAVRFGYRQEVARDLVDAIKENIKNGSTVDETMKRTQLMVS